MSQFSRIGPVDTNLLFSQAYRKRLDADMIDDGDMDVIGESLSASGNLNTGLLIDTSGDNAGLPDGGGAAAASQKTLPVIENATAATPLQGLPLGESASSANSSVTGSALTQNVSAATIPVQQPVSGIPLGSGSSARADNGDSNANNATLGGGGGGNGQNGTDGTNGASTSTRGEDGKGTNGKGGDGNGHNGKDGANGTDGADCDNHCHDGGGGTVNNYYGDTIINQSVHNETHNTTINNTTNNSIVNNTTNIVNNHHDGDTITIDLGGEHCNPYDLSVLIETGQTLVTGGFDLITSIVNTVSHTTTSIVHEVTDSVGGGLDHLGLGQHGIDITHTIGGYTGGLDILQPANEHSSIIDLNLNLGGHDAAPVAVDNDLVDIGVDLLPGSGHGGSVGQDNDVVDLDLGGLTGGHHGTVGSDNDVVDLDLDGLTGHDAGSTGSDNDVVDLDLNLLHGGSSGTAGSDNDVIDIDVGPGGASSGSDHNVIDIDLLAHNAPDGQGQLDIGLLENHEVLSVDLSVMAVDVHGLSSGLGLDGNWESDALPDAASIFEPDGQLNDIGCTTSSAADTATDSATDIGHLADNGLHGVGDMAAGVLDHGVHHLEAGILYGHC